MHVRNQSNGYTSANAAMTESASSTTTDASATERPYSPEDPYGVKGEWIRHDLLDMVPDTPARVLSLGCGTGATEALLQQKGCEVWGIDVSNEAVAIAARRLHRAQVADIETDRLTELEPGSFDLVLAGDVIEHLRFTEHALDRIHGWIKPAGHFVVAIPNAAHHSVVRSLALRRDWKYEDGGLFDRGHYRLFTKKSLLRLLGEHGFAVESMASTRPMSKKLRLLHIVLRPLFWLLPFLDEYLVYTWTIRARKVAR